MFPERKITMIFDMQQTGLAQMVRFIMLHASYVNLLFPGNCTIYWVANGKGFFVLQDMEFIKFIISCFRDYFPRTLGEDHVLSFPHNF